jgi:phosphoribosylanthranilate isomerase
MHQRKISVLACAQIPGATVQFHGDETPQQCQDAYRCAALPAGRAHSHSMDSTPFDLLEFAFSV